MSTIQKQFIKTFLELSDADASKIEKLNLTIYKQTKKTLSILKDKLKVVAPNIKQLRINFLNYLHTLKLMKIFDFNDFINLEMLSVCYSEVDKKRNTDNKFLERNFKELSKLKNLKRLLIDVSSKQTEHYITDVIVKQMPLFQQLDLFRLGIGDNDIKDIGFTTLSNAFCNLKNLKELQLGLEENNLGNDSFNNIFKMISQMDSLEKLMLEFWNNLNDHLDNQTIIPILQDKPVCSNLKELRLGLNIEQQEGQSYKLFEVLGLFNQLRLSFIQYNLKNMNSQIAKGINSILMSNKSTLETFFIDTIMTEINPDQLTNYCITEIFENIDQLTNLQNLYFGYCPNQSPKSAIELFQLLGKSSSIKRIGISSQFTELKKAKFVEQVQLFKSIIDINYLLNIEYSEYDYELGASWSSEFFEIVWKNQSFVDDVLVETVLNQQNNQSQKQKIQKKINKFKEEYLDESLEYMCDQSYNYYKEEDSNSDTENQEYDKEDKEDEEDEDDEDDDYDEDDDDFDYDDDDYDEEEKIQSNDQSSDGGENKSEEENNESDEDQSENKVSKSKQKQKSSNKTLKQQEQAIDNKYKKFVKSLPKFTSQLYLTTQRYFHYKRIEILKYIVYEKQIAHILTSFYPSSSQQIRNFWDLYY